MLNVPYQVVFVFEAAVFTYSEFATFTRVGVYCSKLLYLLLTVDLLIEYIFYFNLDPQLKEN